MADSFTQRVKKAYNAFANQNTETQLSFEGFGVTSFGGRPDRVRLGMGGEKNFLSAVYTRLGIDVAAVDIRHVRNDEDGRFKEDIHSGLHNCLTLEANIDQGSRAFKQDIAMTLCDKGVAAIVPVDTGSNPNQTTGVDIITMRVGEVTQWYPQHVRVRLYNDRTARKEEITLAKRQVAIVENPLYSVMNEPNSTLRRLVRKLNLLDHADEQAGSGKLDMIIQLPYVIKSEARRKEAENRKKDIEMQLRGSQYGIAYTDGTERITQLNRPAENNLLNQIEYLTAQLYSELGLTKEVFEGTASEAAMLNYNNRTIEPIVSAITQAMARSFLTKTARTQGHAIQAFQDPFRLVPITQMAIIADKLSRNEILTSNEIRQELGFKPAKDSRADELRNSNMPHADDQLPLEGTFSPADEQIEEENPEDVEYANAIEELRSKIKSKN